MARAEGRANQNRMLLPVPEQEPERGLFLWWVETALSDLGAAMPKVKEYGGIGHGSADLRVIGKNLAELLDWHEASDAVMQELGCYFYLQGKAARLISDYQQHRPGKADTLADAVTYAMMMRRLQHNGTWP